MGQTCLLYQNLPPVGLDVMRVWHVRKCGRVKVVKWTSIKMIAPVGTSRTDGNSGATNPAKARSHNSKFGDQFHNDGKVQMAICERL